MKAPRTKTPRPDQTEKIKGLYRRGTTWWYAWYQEGVQKFTSLHTKDYGEAVDLAIRLKVAPSLQDGSGLKSEFSRFVAFKRSGGYYERHTAEWVESAVNRLVDLIGDVPAVVVSKTHIDRFWRHLRTSPSPKTKKPLSEASAASYMRGLQSLFSWLVTHKKIQRSPFLEFKTPKVSQAARERFATKELRDKLIAEAPTWDLRFVLYAGFHAGMRKKEIIEAVPAWVDLERGFIHIEETPTFRCKDRESRSIPLTDEFLEFLRATPLNSPFLLQPKVQHGKSLYRYDFRVPFEAYMETQGCPWVTAHVMRHTFASLYIADGGSLHKLSGYLGDSPLVTDKHYAHLVPDRDDIQRSHRKPVLAQATLPI
jgi:integrase